MTSAQIIPIMSAIVTSTCIRATAPLRSSSYPHWPCSGAMQLVLWAGMAIFCHSALGQEVAGSDVSASSPATPATTPPPDPSSGPKAEPPIPENPQPAPQGKTGSDAHKVTAPEPFTPEPPKAVTLERRRGKRPSWRLALGGLLILGGATAVAAAAFYFSLNGKCVDSSCLALYETNNVSVPLLTVGLGGLVAGAVTVALPGPVFYAPVSSP